MYDIIHTDAYILSEREEGEASKVFFVLSKELGFISVHAQSIKKGTAKLKSLIHPYRKISLDIIIGKKKYQIATGLFVNSFDVIFYDPDKKKSFLHTLNLLVSLIPRNIKIAELYDFYDEYISDLCTVQKKEDIISIESIFVAQLLCHLGYLESNLIFEKKDDTTHTALYAKKLIPHINKVLRTIHL